MDHLGMAVLSCRATSWTFGPTLPEAPEAPEAPDLHHPWDFRFNGAFMGFYGT
jgi:hypothetical protein